MIENALFLKEADKIIYAVEINRKHTKVLL